MSIVAIILLIIIVMITLLFIFQRAKQKDEETLDVDESQHKGFSPSDKIDTALTKDVPKELKTIFKNIEYTEIGKNIFPVNIEQIDDEIKTKFEKNIKSMLPIPIDYTRLMKLLLNPETNIKEIVSLVSTHPVLSAKVLQTVNSVYFSLAEKVTSIGRAITLLGYNNVRALVLQETLYNTVCKDKTDQTDRHLRLWAHSAIVSACAGFIGKKLFGLSEYDLATAGLLHDIGKFYLMNIEEGFEIVTDIPNLIKEEHRYGINHSVAGAFIAKQWLFSNIIVKGIEYHHHPCYFPPENIPSEYLKLNFILCVSDLVSKAMGYKGEDEQMLRILPEYFELFGIDKDLKDIITVELIININKTKATVESYIDSVTSTL